MYIVVLIRKHTEKPLKKSESWKEVSFFLCSARKTPTVALFKNLAAFVCRDKNSSIYSEHFILGIQEESHGRRNMA